MKLSYWSKKFSGTQQSFAFISMGKLSLFLNSVSWDIFCVLCIVLRSPFLCTMFFSTLSPYLVFLEPEGMSFMVSDLLGEKFRMAFIGQRCLRFWKLELGSSKGCFGGQRDACSSEQRYVELVLPGADRAWVRRWMASSYIQPRSNPQLSLGSPRNRSRKSNERIGTAPLCL